MLPYIAYMDPMGPAKKTWEIMREDPRIRINNSSVHDSNICSTLR